MPRNQMYERGYESYYILTAQMDEIRARAKHDGKFVVRELEEVIAKGLKVKEK